MNTTEEMKNLSKETRNTLIEEAENVVDLRPKLLFKKRQRQLAEAYRKGTWDDSPVA